MKPSDITAVITQLATMWPGDLSDEARLIWTDKLSEFDDNDPLVRTAFDACLATCTYRPTWADFTTAYLAARTAALQPARQEFHALPKAPRTGPNPVSRIKAELAARKAELRRPHHDFTPGDLVTVNRVQLADPLQGKTGTYLGMSPDKEWLRVDLKGQVRLMKPSQLTGEQKA